MRSKYDADAVYQDLLSKSAEGVERNEWWTFLALEKQQRLRLPLANPRDTDGAPYWFCTEGLSFGAFKFLCNSVESLDLRPEQDPKTTWERHSVQTRLERLPHELLVIIFTLSEPRDCMALALGSQTLWQHAVTWAQNGYVRWRNEYSWANTPIICAGSKLDILPQSIYNICPESIPDELPGTDPWDTTEPRIQTRSKTWYHEAMESYQRTPFPFDDAYVDAFSKHINFANIPEIHHGLMKGSLPTLIIEQGSKWWLRNLSKSEYICMEATTTRDGEMTVSVGGTNWLTLDMLLLWLISWRGEGSQEIWSWEELEDFVGFTDMNLEDTVMDPTYGPLDHKFWPIWAGNWAGDRLDVVAECEIDANWVDRTSWVDTLANKMMRTFYGLALAEGNSETQRYWAEIFKKSGGVIWLHVSDHSSGAAKIQIVKYDPTASEPWEVQPKGTKV
ncbi:hypothetical protein FGRMN_2933 [Fusarium graminum]|nr:hypothetical protein FGRMN_2933 [Fusarium graminum]